MSKLCYFLHLLHSLRKASLPTFKPTSYRHFLDIPSKGFRMMVERSPFIKILQWIIISLLIIILVHLPLQQYFIRNSNEKKRDSANVNDNVDIDRRGQKEVGNNNSAGGDGSLTLDINYVEENYYSLDQKDPQLIKFTRVRYLTPPSKLPYSYQGEGKHPNKHTTFVTQFFQNKRNGVFIEAGANKGGIYSKSLYLEKNLGWSGLLVECNPKVVPSLKSNHRKAWVGSVCLAPTTTPGVLNFSNPTSWSYSGTFRKPWKIPIKTTWEFFEVETLPLYTLLAALGWKEIDYFLFDIEGSELSILKTFPFDQVIFKVLIIEVFFYTKKEKEELNELLKSNDYHFVTKLEIDHVYVHNSVKHQLTNVNVR